MRFKSICLTGVSVIFVTSTPVLANQINTDKIDFSINQSTVSNENHEQFARSVKYRGFPRKRRGTGRRVFIFSPRSRMWAAYDGNGNLVRTGRASGGKHYCPDIRRSCRTPGGVYRVRSKGGPGCRSARYPVGRGGAPMPYCMFYSRYYAIHGSPYVPRHNASHGCIRVLPSAARWLSNNFIRIGTIVIVRSY